MPKRQLAMNVFDAALARLKSLYEAGHTVVVSYSAGKDSTVCLELAILAATETNRLPVHVVIRDEEIMLPGTYELAERTAQRDEVDFHWLVAGQPVINCFNRANPYFFVFDDRLSPDEWVRQPPDFAKWIPEQNIGAMVTALSTYMLEISAFRDVRKRGCGRKFNIPIRYHIRRGKKGLVRCHISMGVKRSFSSVTRVFTVIPTSGTQKTSNMSLDSARLFSSISSAALAKGSSGSRSLSSARRVEAGNSRAIVSKRSAS